MSRGDVRWRKYQEIMVSATHTGLFNIPVFSLVGFNIETSAPEFPGTRWMHIWRSSNVFDAVLFHNGMISVLLSNMHVQSRGINTHVMSIHTWR